MEAITLKNAWANRIEIIARCKAQGACRAQFSLLKAAKTSEDFVAVLFRNLSWCVARDILDYNIEMVYAGIISRDGKIRNVRLGYSVFGTNYWMVDINGDLVMPYSDWNYSTMPTFNATWIAASKNYKA